MKQVNSCALFTATTENKKTMNIELLIGIFKNLTPAGWLLTYKSGNIDVISRAPDSLELREAAIEAVYDLSQQADNLRWAGVIAATPSAWGCKDSAGYRDLGFSEESARKAALHSEGAEVVPLFSAKGIFCANEHRLRDQLKTSQRLAIELSEGWDDLLEDLELHGMHSFEPYLKSKSWFNKIKPKLRY